MVSVGVFITVAIFVLGVMPTRQWLNNRRAIAAAESTLAGLEARNQQATDAADSLRSGSELERLAREQYGYARPGEEVYHVLPAPMDPVRVPDAWPFTALGSSISR
jgi:cell division protein FtsB